MFRRIPQPPIDPHRRKPECHDFWPGFVVVIAGALLAIGGARHLTSVDTVGGSSAWESQLIRGFTFGGLQYADEQAPAPPPNLAEVANPAEALDRWAKQQANGPGPAWKVRVDTGAKTPCPT